MFEHVREDLRRYGTRPSEQLLGVVLHPGAWAVLGYRMRRWAREAPLPRPAKRALGLVGAATDLGLRLLTKVELPTGASIGPGLLVVHGSYLVLSSNVRIGSHCTLAHGVTIGHGAGGRGDSRAGPNIGDRVYVGPGAAVVGPIEVGSDALVGIGAVVTRSVPERGVVAGNPARLLSTRGSFEIIRYPGMERDPERAESLVRSGEAAGEP
jgi:serine O-acetyltransferase